MMSNVGEFQIKKLLGPKKEKFKPQDILTGRAEFRNH
jgi:hypothetical protein